MSGPGTGAGEVLITHQLAALCEAADTALGSQLSWLSSCLWEPGDASEGPETPPSSLVLGSAEIWSSLLRSSSEDVGVSLFA